MQTLTSFSQLIYLVIYIHLLRRLGTFVSGLICMSGIPARLVLSISGILSDSEGISNILLFFWLQTPWLEVVLTTVIPCLEVSLLLIFTGSSVFKTVLLELWPIPSSTHISLL